MRYAKLAPLGYVKELHSKHKRKWSAEDREYLINYYYIAGSEEISLALDRTEISIIAEVTRLVKLGIMEEKKTCTPRLLLRKDDYITVHYNY